MNPYRPGAFPFARLLIIDSICLIDITCFFFWLAHGKWSSQARDQIRVAAVTHATLAAMLDFLTHCVGLGIEHASWHCQEATDAIAPQQEILSLFRLSISSCMNPMLFLTNFIIFSPSLLRETHLLCVIT